MSKSLLVEYYLKLPQPQLGDDPDLLEAGMQHAMREFGMAVGERYSESTLQRLLASGELATRRAAALALGLLGTFESNPYLGKGLQDDDTLLRKFAADSLWAIWLRSGSDEQNQELAEALQLPDLAQALAALDELVREAPEFAEARNQRAMLRFRRGDYSHAAKDCKAVLKLNPFHFGAAAGLGQCLIRMNKPRAALVAYQNALAIHPGLDLAETIRELESALDEDL